MATISNGNNLIPSTGSTGSTGFGGFPSPVGAGLGGGIWGSSSFTGLGASGLTGSNASTASNPLTGISALTGASALTGTSASNSNSYLQNNAPLEMVAQQNQQLQQMMMQMLQMMMQSMSGLGGSSAGSTGGAGGGGVASPVSSGGGSMGGTGSSGGTGASSGTGSSGSYDGASTGSSSGVNSGAAANAKVVAQQAQALGVDPVTAVATMLVESGGNNDAVGDNGTSFGLFQLHKGGELGNLTQAQAENPATNAKVALSVFAQNKGKYSDPGQLAAASQRPADPQAYAQKVDAEIPEAKKLLGMS